MTNSKKIIKLMALALLLVIIGLTLWQGQSIDAAAITQYIEDYGAWAWLVFMVLYIVGTIFFFPGSVLTLAGGAIFGPVLGTFLNLTSATIGAGLAFLVARYMASDWVENKTGGRLKQLKNGVENEGWRFVAFVRLVPLFPFNLLNYALGITRIRFSHYLFTTYICMFPGALAYTYLGYAGREAVGGGDGLIQKVMLALALLAVVAFLPRIISHFRMGSTMNAVDLHDRIQNDRAPVVLDLRSAEDYSGNLGHIPGAINIPLEQLGPKIDELNDMSELPVALVCNSDRQSQKAARILATKGFADVTIVLGGMTKWNEHNYAVEKGYST